MTSKDKAQELYDKMENSIFLEQYTWEEQCKQCALIVVNEIIASNIFEQNHQDYIHPFIADKNGYWREVKQEIEKL